MAVKKKSARPAQSRTADSYQHKTADSPMRPEVGTQSQFRKRKPPKTYQYDSSLDPALSWDGNNGSRVLGNGYWPASRRLLACPLHIASQNRRGSSEPMARLSRQCAAWKMLWSN
jgi:hypothetical protein